MGAGEASQTRGGALDPGPTGLSGPSAVGAGAEGRCCSRHLPLNTRLLLDIRAPGGAGTQRALCFWFWEHGQLRVGRAVPIVTFRSSVRGPHTPQVPLSKIWALWSWVGTVTLFPLT